MRNSFINTLILNARKDSKIFLLCGDIGYSVLESFAKEFPDRFINVGISEQNMISVAAGLSLEGYNVFVYSLGNFPTIRPLEQIRYNIAYHNLNVKIIAVGAGYAYGHLGASHHMTEDISILRSIPNILITAPSDPVEATGLANFLSSYTGPAYIRLNKAGEKKLHELELSFSLGDIKKIKSGSKIAVLAVGSINQLIKEEIEDLNINASLYSFPFVNNVNKAELLRILNEYSIIITAEENQLNGGFGSSILEAINDFCELNLLNNKPRIYRLGINNEFQSCAGSQEFFRSLANISLKKLKNIIKSLST
jgi:transketolase